MEPVETPPNSSKRRPRLVALVLVALAAAIAGYFMMRKSSPATQGQASAAQPAPDALVPGSQVLLSAKAAIVADRYNCLCGECSDTLGKCVCARDKGSNEMKTTLNKLAAEKKTVPEIDAAMAAKYGPKVLAPGTASQNAPASGQ
jgi:hypothetical protein